MNKLRGWICAPAVWCLLGSLATAAPAPVAVVEEVRGTVAGIEFMDYVAPGRVIKLSAKDLIVLGYMKSCWRETITGGTVTVGEEHSAVRGGRVERSRVPCGANAKPLGAREATQSAATVFRTMRPDESPARAPLATVFGRSPMIEIDKSRDSLLIERIDEGGERVEVPIAGPALVRGRFLDLARTDIALTPGASYAISQGKRRLEFKVAAEAEPGAAPLAGRLLRFD